MSVEGVYNTEGSGLCATSGLNESSEGDGISCEAFCTNRCPYRVGHEVLCRWNDGLLYLGIVIKVDEECGKCLVKFEDNSLYWTLLKDMQRDHCQESDILCTVCQSGVSEKPNEIVLCDACGLGYHQGCHSPCIPSEVLLPDVEWVCQKCILAANSTKLCLKEQLAKKGPAGKTMQHNVTSLPYELRSLTWDPQHKINDQHCYCYCSGPGQWWMKMLQCCKCRQWFHEACLKCLTKPLLYGDRFYVFVCSVCNSGPEYIKRLPLKWTDIAHLVIYNLSIELNKKYFDFALYIMPFVNSCWDTLQLQGNIAKTRAEDRRTHMQAALIASKTRFKSGKEIKKRNNIWGLRMRMPPSAPKVILPAVKPITDHVVNSLKIQGRRNKVLVPLRPLPISPSSRSSETSTTSPSPPKKPNRKRRRSDLELLMSMDSSPPVCTLFLDETPSCKLLRLRAAAANNGSSKVKQQLLYTGNAQPTVNPKIKSVAPPKDPLPKAKKHSLKVPQDRAMRGEKMNQKGCADGSEANGYASSVVSNCKKGVCEDSSEDDGDDTSSRATLESIIPAPTNFNGQNNPFCTVNKHVDQILPSNLPPPPLVAPFTKPLRRKVGTAKNGPKRNQRRQAENDEGSLINGAGLLDFAANGHGAVGGGPSSTEAESIRGPTLLFDDLKFSVTSYFGAANRIASGERFNVLARRVTPEGRVQYLIEWEGLGM